jgi:iron(III) transport system ATP-binding protein
MTGVAKAYGNTQVLKGISMDVRPGEFLTLLGPSGCGKTTLLRILAGLVPLDTGSVSFGPDVVADAAADRHLPPDKRGVGMVFQDYALWPHMRVADNVRFPLDARNDGPGPQRAQRVQQALQRVGLEQYGHRYPGELSGGQQQRVALARAIVAEPKVVLFDEPLSNLDAGLRDMLGREIASLIRTLGLTTVYVTHDQSEALALSDRIAIMHQGEIVQCGSPEMLYNNPVNAWVADFLNAGSLLAGRIEGGQFQAEGSSTTPINLKDQPLPQGRGRLLLPAQAIRLGRSAGQLELQVAMSQFRGDRYEIHATLPAQSSQPALRFWHTQALDPGARIAVDIDAACVRFFSEPDTTFLSNQKGSLP